MFDLADNKPDPLITGQWQCQQNNYKSSIAFVWGNEDWHKYWCLLIHSLWQYAFLLSFWSCLGWTLDSQINTSFLHVLMAWYIMYIDPTQLTHAQACPCTHIAEHFLRGEKGSKKTFWEITLKNTQIHKDMFWNFKCSSFTFKKK